MTHTTVDVICSMEGGFPIILEVIDSENLQLSLDRQEYYKKYYEDVHLFGGITLTKDNKNNDK